MTFSEAINFIITNHNEAKAIRILSSIMEEKIEELEIKNSNIYGNSYSKTYNEIENHK